MRHVVAIRRISLTQPDHGVWPMMITDREVRVHAIGGGSEEVMFDLAMRQAKL